VVALAPSVVSVSCKLTNCIIPVLTVTTSSGGSVLEFFDNGKIRSKEFKLDLDGN
jgi:hypothetical protein